MRVPLWKKTFIFLIPFLVIKYVISNWVPMEYMIIHQLPYLFLLGSLVFWSVTEKIQVVKGTTPPANIESAEAEIQLLVKQEQPIRAIKLARQSLGLSLLEAKNYVDSLIELGKNKK